MIRRTEMKTLEGFPCLPALVLRRAKPGLAPATWAALLAVFLVSLPLHAQGIVPPEGYKPTKKIVRLYEAKCATCHGDDGKAKTELGKEMAIDDMTKAAYWKDLTLEGSRKAVLEGIKRTHNGVEQEMKPFKDRLSPDQVDALIIYSASLKK